MAQEDRKRKQSGEDARGVGEIQQVEYNEKAGAKKVLGPILGKLVRTPGGSPGVITTAASMSSAGKLVALFNNSASVAWALTGDSSVAVPTSANGIALPPNAYTILALGPHTHVRADVGTVVAYEIEDNTYWA
jgi:hypothetical protein